MESKLNPLLGRAAKKEIQTELLQLMQHTSLAFLAQAIPPKATRGLIFNGGNQKIKTAIQQQLDSDAELLEWHSDDLNIEANENKFDFIYSPMLFSYFKNPLKRLRGLQRILKPKAILLVEDLDLGNLNCFPHSFAFEQFKDLFKAVTADPQFTSRGFYQRVEADLQAAGFNPPKSQFRSPTFLHPRYKRMPSLVFESIMYRIEDQQLATTDEAHALLAELKAFEAHPHTMISLPGIYQIKAEKLSIEND